jgi:hypothetical protein
VIGGKPDSRYGWLDVPGKGLHIVKEIDTDLSAYAGTLLSHERKMLHRLAELGAPAPALLDVGRDDWLVTRFGGLSLQRLQHPMEGYSDGDHDNRNTRAAMGYAETLATWIHLLRRLQPMADAGVLAIDLYEANVVCPLADQTTGQLRLNHVALIDHAHTMESSMNLRRPVWLDTHMARIPPELRHALQQDQTALRDAFSAKGAALPGQTLLPGNTDALSRQTWAEYDADQQLQRLLDKGVLSRDHAMQFAIGTALVNLCKRCPHPQSRAALERVAHKMTAQKPADRYTTLTTAANALQDQLHHLPLASTQSYGPLRPHDLATPETDVPPMAADGTAYWYDGPPNAQDGGQRDTLSDTLSDATSDTSSHANPATAPAKSASNNLTPWLYAAIATGAAAGTLWPLPW